MTMVYVTVLQARSGVAKKGQNSDKQQEVTGEPYKDLTVLQSMCCTTLLIHFQIRNMWVGIGIGVTNDS